MQIASQSEISGVGMHEDCPQMLHEVPSIGMHARESRAGVPLPQLPLLQTRGVQVRLSIPSVQSMVTQVPYAPQTGAPQVIPLVLRAQASL